MYHVYILFSEKINEYYCGQTHDIENRINEHNTGETKSIKHGIPWKLIGYLVFETRNDAMKKEKSIKNRGIKRWLGYSKQDLIQKI